MAWSLACTSTVYLSRCRPDPNLDWRELLQPQPNQQPIQQLVIQPQRIRDLIGFDKDRPRFRGVLLRQVLEERGEWAGVQINAVQVEIRDSIASVSGSTPHWSRRDRPGSTVQINAAAMPTRISAVSKMGRFCECHADMGK